MFDLDRCLDSSVSSKGTLDVTAVVSLSDLGRPRSTGPVCPRAASAVEALCGLERGCEDRAGALESGSLAKTSVQVAIKGRTRTWTCGSEHLKTQMERHGVCPGCVSNKDRCRFYPFLSHRVVCRDHSFSHVCKQ